MSSLILTFNCSIGYVAMPLSEEGISLALVNGISVHETATNFQPNANSSDWLFCSTPKSYPLIFMTRLTTLQHSEDNCHVVRTIHSFIRFVLKDTRLPPGLIRLPEEMVARSLELAGNLTCRGVPIGSCGAEQV